MSQCFVLTQALVSLCSFCVSLQHFEFYLGRILFSNSNLNIIFFKSAMFIGSATAYLPSNLAYSDSPLIQAVEQEEGIIGLIQ